MGSMFKSTRGCVLFFFFLGVIQSFISQRQSLQSQSLQSLHLGDEASVILPTTLVELNAEGAKPNECFPSRLADPRGSTITVVHIDIGTDLHLETIYSFVERLCSCSPNKPPIWTLKNGTTPRFFFGRNLSSGARRILAEYDKSTCGPLIMKKPRREPDLTVITTTYPKDFKLGNRRRPLLNDPRYLLICHKRAESFVENATNVYFLTPRHRNYIVPSYFPPSFVKGHKANANELVFLVMGGVSRNQRNLASLANAMDFYKTDKFVVRFLGKHNSTELFHKIGGAFGRHRDKIEVVENADAYNFMTNVSDAHVILPLVDNTNYRSQYQSGMKLTSSVTWGLGFHKKMIIFDSLASDFGLYQDNVTYWTYGDPNESFVRAFGLCLRHLQLD